MSSSPSPHATSATLLLNRGVQACQVSACACVECAYVNKTLSHQRHQLFLCKAFVFVFFSLTYRACVRSHVCVVHTHRSSGGAHGWHSYCGLRTHSDALRACRPHAARGIYVSYSLSLSVCVRMHACVFVCVRVSAFVLCVGAR
jgi:hypothetical protein